MFSGGEKASAVSELILSSGKSKNLNLTVSSDPTRRGSVLDATEGSETPCEVLRIAGLISQFNCVGAVWCFEVSRGAFRLRGCLLHVFRF